MGNHAAGSMIVNVATAMFERRRSGETAIQILDAAVEKAKASPGYSSDTEYDDAPWKDGPFRSLLIEAFGNGDDFADDDDGERFFDNCYWPFKQRTGQC